MADRRMFSKKITDSDAFIEMPSTTQALYFHLNQAADDDGFNNQVQVAMMKSHASVDDLRVLMLKNFVIRFESGLIVIKHWRIHNTLRKDRHTPTTFQDELAMLHIKPNMSYTLSDVGCQMVAERLPDGCPSIGKDSIDKITTPIAHNGGDDVPKETKSDERFKAFWNAYPKKVGKGAAEKSFQKFKPDDSLLEKMLKAINTQKQTDQWKKDGGQFIPNPSTWLNQKRWEDETTSQNDSWGGIQRL